MDIRFRVNLNNGLRVNLVCFIVAIGLLIVVLAQLSIQEFIGFLYRNQNTSP